MKLVVLAAAVALAISGMVGASQIQAQARHVAQPQPLDEDDDPMDLCVGRKESFCGRPYVEGLIGEVAAVMSRYRATGVCLPEQVSLGRAVGVVLAYLHRYPARQREPGATVREALGKAFPCRTA